ncbi:MAG: hypothetical protein ACRD5W_08175, partial [Candidatus Acidiferrales bacterium]
MADWRQIQARIRKAKLSADPIPALTRIYDRTRDGMAAFELATVHENAGRMEEAVGWYTKAWQRFRRADWKQKSAEAIERLGGSAPQDSGPVSATQAGESEAAETATFSRNEFLSRGPTGDEVETVVAEAPETEGEAEASDASGGQGGATQAAVGSIKKRSRRGRRGGRRHRRKREHQAQPQMQTPAQQAAQVEPSESGVASVVEMPPRAEER